MAERNNNGTITLTTEELAELTAQAAKMAVESKGLSNAAAYAALRAIGNVTNVTETLGLPLPENNETVAYQDFINSANLIIDNFAKTTNNTLDSVGATAASAANGVAAADTKIANITTRLDNDQVDSLPQFKQDTEDRLDSVENDVMGLSGWSAFITTPSGEVTQGVQKSSIGLYIGSRKGISSQWVDLTEVVKLFFGFSQTDAYIKKSLMGSAQGNVYNLPEINVIYSIGTYSFDADGTPHTSGIGLKWTGVVTELYELGTSESANQYSLAAIYPFTKL